MPRTSPPQPPQSLHEIYIQWTEALSLPLTPRLSNLRRLTITITSKSTSNITLHPIPLSRLFLDLSLTYAYLGEYHLASLGFARAAKTRNQRPFALFALGLSRAELGDWKEAKKGWIRCLDEFGEGDGRQEVIPYQAFQQGTPHNSLGDVTTRNIGFGRQWLLERERVEFNLHRAHLETRGGCKRLGIKRPRPEDRRFGLNGIPAGFRFGPDGWFNAEMERAEAKVLRPLEEIGKAFPSRSSPQSSDSSPTMKSLPPLPPRPKAPAASRGSKVWFANKLTPREALIPGSPSSDPASLPSPSMYDSSSSLGRNSIRSHSSTSPDTATSNPLSFSFSDSFRHDSNHECSIRGFSGIDEAMALWDLPLSHPVFTHRGSPHAIPPEENDNEEYDSDEYNNDNYNREHYNDGGDIQNDTTPITDFLPGDTASQEFIQNKGLSSPHTPHRGMGDEILQPRVFEGFGPRM